MSFNLLYVEDRDKDWEKIEAAVRAHNQQPEADSLRIERAKNPEEVTDRLDPRFDLVIADVYYKNSDGDLVDRLRDIINSVKAFCSESGGRPIPIIAYTQRGKAALESCLLRKEDLYDIWDKSIASPHYVAWRLAKLAKEFSRIRPDSMLQRLIRGMHSGATWHEDVIKMARRYDEGWTERDQIERAGKSIEDILHAMGVYQTCIKLWGVMTEWEYVGRAVSRQMRGHSRHVINVFWLGYYLLHHELLKDHFAGWWKNLLGKRGNTGLVKDQSPMEALSNSWVFAGLFHDVGGCVERSMEVKKHFQAMLDVFGPLKGMPSKLDDETVCDLVGMATELLYEFEDPMRSYVRSAVEKSVKNEKPDQGVVAAVHLRSTINTGPQSFYAREGGRAASLHNIFAGLNDGVGSLPVSWEDEPIVCLLLLCDQLQTWDRQRYDDTRYDDLPSRAELTKLTVELDGKKPVIDMSIDYVAPAHLAHLNELYGRVKDRLDTILKEYPSRTLERINTPWPFTLRVRFSLSGDPLSTKIQI